MSDLAAIIMAAGKGTRMNDPDRAKVMFPVGNRPMIAHVCDQALKIGASPVVIVVGHRGDEVEAYLKNEFEGEDLLCVRQEPQLGTAHAVAQAEPVLNTFQGDILVLSGDVPLLRWESLDGMVKHHQKGNCSATVMTVTPENPEGYGRVIRNDNGSVAKIIEHKDASDSERSVREINAGIYLFNAHDLFSTLPEVSNANAQGEYYLPDVISLLLQSKKKVSSFSIDDPREVSGINTVDQLAEVDSYFAQIGSTAS